MIDYSDRQSIKNIFNEIPDFQFITVKDCQISVDLIKANEILSQLNKKINCTNLKISIDYVFQMKTNTEINTYNDYYTDSMLLLCIFTDDKCVSSLIINYDNEKYDIFVESQTKKEYEGKKYNKLLRATIIILARSLYPTVKSFTSKAVNMISAHIMMKNFGAVPYDYDVNAKKLIFENDADLETYFKETGGIKTTVEINENSEMNAQRVFSETIATNPPCPIITKGGKRMKKSMFAFGEESGGKRRISRCGKQGIKRHTTHNRKQKKTQNSRRQAGMMHFRPKVSRE